MHRIGKQSRAFSCGNGSGLTSPSTTKLFPLSMLSFGIARPSVRPSRPSEADTQKPRRQARSSVAISECACVRDRFNGGGRGGGGSIQKIWGTEDEGRSRGKLGKNDGGRLYSMYGPAGQLPSPWLRGRTGGPGADRS